MLPCLSQLVCVGGFSVACLGTDVILHVLSEKCGFLASPSGAQWKKPIFSRPSLATVMLGGGLTHVIPSLCCSLGSLQSLATERTVSWNQPKFLRDAKNRDSAIQKQQRDLPTQTESLQEINSHLFISEYLPPLSTMNSWNIFQPGKLPGAVFPKADVHILVSLMPLLPIWALFYQPKPLKHDQSLLFAAADGTLGLSSLALGHLPQDWVLRAVLSAGLEGSEHSFPSPQQRAPGPLH